jgi:two-component system chemotaxis response regulator CheB
VKTHYLFPGKLAAFKEETIVSTLLGSCVAVALYDPMTKIGGINHYLLPELAENDVPSGRYGNAAIEMLIEEMVNLGASPSRLQAKVYGGGNVIAVSFSGLAVGTRNIELALSELGKRGIRIVEKSVGGDSGRTLKFNTHTFEVLQHFSGEGGSPTTTENGTSAAVRPSAIDVSGFRSLPSLKSVKVLIVDDSATVRTLFTTIFQKSGLEVVGAAADPYQAREMISSLKPDVLTLDIEMPRMSGVVFLEKLMKHQPMPVVMVSSLGSQGDAALRALELGAVEFVHKPSQFDPQVLKDLANTLVAKVKAAATVKSLKAYRESAPPKDVAAVVSAGASSRARKAKELKLVVLGGNAGSAPALEKVLEGLAIDTPPVVVACSLITHFVESFVVKMKSRTRVTIKCARDGDWLTAGNVYILPAGFHGKVLRTPSGIQLKLETGAPVCSQIPSADVLFSSAAEVLQSGVYGILLGGFGSDGVQGLTNLQNRGGMTVAQHPDEASFPFAPQKAVETGVVEEILNAGEIASHLMRYRNQSVV